MQKQQRQWIIAILLLLISVLARLPYYFVDVINWDESTFILMGQSLLDGHLPYTELWDIKPPLAFAAYALFILTLGKSILAIRIAGTLCVFLTAWFVCLIGKHLGNSAVGILAGITTIFAMSLIRGGQSTLTEHVACVFLLAGLTWLITHKTTAGVLFLGGILLTAAALIRLNLAYGVIAVGIWLVFQKLKHQKLAWQGILAYCLGSFGLIFLTYLPYLLTGDGAIWVDSVVLASLDYANSGEPQGIWSKILSACLIYLALNQLWQRASVSKRQEFGILQVLLFSIVISIIRGGEFHQHYLIQLAPLLALTVILLWVKLPSRLGRLILVGLFAVVLLDQANPIYGQYQLIGDRLSQGKPLNHGISYEIVEFLAENNPEQKPVYMMRNHLVYWLMDLKPLSKVVTHPSNIGKDYLFKHIEGAEISTEAELRKILAQKPEFIVRQDSATTSLPYLEKEPEAYLFLQETLTTKYNLVKEIENRKIYQRMSDTQ